MIRNPNWPLSPYSTAYKREELIHLRDLLARIEEYGGLSRLKMDITTLEKELEHA